MDCSSICDFSLCSLTEPRKPKFLKPRLFNGNKTLSLNPPQSFSFHPKLQFTTPLQLGKFHFLEKPFHRFSNFPQSTTILRKPTSNPSKIQFFDTSQSSICKFCAEKIAVLLVGSLIFMGGFNLGPALALPTAQKSSSSAHMEEKRDTQNGRSENEEMFLKILEKNPRNAEALKVVLYGKMRKGETKEAVEYVERLIDVEPDEVEWRLLQALSYEIMGHLSKAKRLFKEILEERPILLRALHGLAMVMHKNHEGPAVFEMLDEALEVARRANRVTEERNIRILSAQMHVVKGDLEEGLKKFQDLVNENPRDFRPYLCQGIIYSLLDKRKEAEEQFETYRTLVPQEFPQRGFLDDVVLAAKTESRERLEKEFETTFSYRK